jgi:hypothetical protein
VFVSKLFLRSKIVFNGFRDEKKLRDANEAAEWLMMQQIICVQIEIQRLKVESARLMN